MNKIFTITDIPQAINQFNAGGEKLVLVGGCFDILHIGHITFLEKAKETGDILVVFLESDEQIKKSKGENRPFNTQEDRAHILAALTVVDAIILLPPMPNDKSYDDLVSLIKPAIIATTKGDPEIIHKRRQAGTIKAQVLEVTSPVRDQSTSRLAKLLENENL